MSAEPVTRRDALRLGGFHHRLSELQGAELTASVEFNQAIGNRNLIIRSLARTHTWRRTSSTGRRS